MVQRGAAGAPADCTRNGVYVQGGERLSWLSSGIRELGAHIACFGVEANEEFVGEGDTDHLFRFAREGQSAVEGGEIGIVPAHERSDEERFRADAAAPAAD